MFKWPWKKDIEANQPESFISVHLFWHEITRLEQKIESLKGELDDLRQKQQPGIKPAKSRSDSIGTRKPGVSKRPARDKGNGGVRKTGESRTRKTS